MRTFHVEMGRTYLQSLHQQRFDVHLSDALESLTHLLMLYGRNEELVVEYTVSTFLKGPNLLQQHEAM